MGGGIGGQFRRGRWVEILEVNKRCFAMMEKGTGCNECATSSAHEQWRLLTTRPSFENSGVRRVCILLGIFT